MGNRFETLLVAGLAVLVVGAGAAWAVGATTPAPTAVVAGDAGQPVTGSADVQVANNTTPDDPPVDVLGWENGYWYDEAIDVDQSDGLTEAETEAYVARAMARVEQIGGLEFERDVNVTVLTREEYRNASTGTGQSASYWAWNNQVWEGMFTVGEETNVSDAFGELTGETVLGFYEPATDRLVVVSDDPERPVIDNATLVHELVHALQDQRYDLTRSKYQGTTQDEQLAVGALVEGEATLVEEYYVQNCREEWACVATPGNATSGGGEFNVGILVTLLSQYSDGMALLDQLVEQYGWDAIGGLHEDPPETMEQVVQADIDEEPVPIEFEDRARDGWVLFEGQGENGSDTLGEASIYSMFWYQTVEYGTPLVDQNEFLQPDSGEFDYYNYSSEPSSGWANDRLFPYRNGDQFGYVWVTEWDTEADATQFRQTYLKMLAGHGVDLAGPRTLIVESGPFADAFRVVQDGTTVTIVNAPNETALDDIRPGIDEAANATGGA